MSSDVAERTVVDGVDVLGSLSPSRASDFMTCPLLFRFRTVDRLPEPSSPDAVRGTVVHKVLEDLFDLPASDRTPARAADLLVPAWEAILEADPSIAEMFGSAGPEIGAWLASCQDSLGRYFALEDPTRLEPAERELYVETLLDSKLLLRGFVDRLDVAPTGEIRVVDYKTGKAPHEAFEAKALFQMKFYALVIWRTRGVVPRMLPRQRRAAALLPRRAGPARHRAQGRGAVEGDRHRAGERRLAAAQERTVRLVRTPVDLSGVGRNAAPAADAGAGRRADRRPRPRGHGLTPG
jgi:RecB family exonuclease